MNEGMKEGIRKEGRYNEGRKEGRKDGCLGRGKGRAGKGGERP